MSEGNDQIAISGCDGNIISGYSREVHQKIYPRYLEFLLVVSIFSESPMCLV